MGSLYEKTLAPVLGFANQSTGVSPYHIVRDYSLACHAGAIGLAGMVYRWALIMQGLKNVYILKYKITCRSIALGRHGSYM